MADKKNGNPPHPGTDVDIHWRSLGLKDVLVVVLNAILGLVQDGRVEEALDSFIPAFAEEFTKLYLRIKEACQKIVHQAQTA